MKLSTKGRYGLRALIDICIYSSSDMVTVKSISERQGISERYLEQIMVFYFLMK
jgi:DNA-binding IscR family transcriptional regulator